MRPRFVLAVFSLLWALGSTAARADGPMARYQGMHPLSPHQGAFCYIDAPHMHRLPPPDLRVYLVAKDGTNVFIGDPVALGYDGPKFGYFGPHPLAVPATLGLPPTFCYISGPHYHAAPQPASAALVEKAGVIWYLGPLPPPADPGRVWINEVHPITGYAAPKVNLAMAPPGYHAFTVGPPSPATAPAATGKAKPVPGPVPGAPARAAKRALAPANPTRGPTAPGGQP